MGKSQRTDFRISDNSNYGKYEKRRISKSGVEMYRSGSPENNRLTSVDATMMANNHPDVPRSSDHVDSLFRGKIPMTRALSGLVLDEQQFLNKEELREKVEEGLAQLKTQELEFAHGILQGKTAAEAYLDAGYQQAALKKLGRKEALLSARKEATKLRKRDVVESYISAVLRLKHLEAMENVGFTHVQWLEAQRSVLEMALGQKKIRKVFIKDGNPEEHEVQDVCLGVANRSLETLAKHYGWLNEKLHIEGAGLGPTVLLRDFTGAKSEEPEVAQDAEQADDEADSSDWDS